MDGAEEATGTTLMVVDALDHPHGGRILRTRVTEGVPPSVRSLRGAMLEATSPEGTRVTVKMLGFPVFGGRPSDSRIRETGRVDLLVVSVPPNGPSPGLGWELRASAT
jgi:hypothetical protein